MGPLPSATPPKEMAVFALVTGVTHQVAAFAYRGGSFFERRKLSHGWDFGEAPTGRPAHRYRLWPQHQRGASNHASDVPCHDVL